MGTTFSRDSRQQRNIMIRALASVSVLVIASAVPTTLDGKLAELEAKSAELTVHYDKKASADVTENGLLGGYNTDCTDLKDSDFSYGCREPITQEQADEIYSYYSQSGHSSNYLSAYGRNCMRACTHDQHQTDTPCGNGGDFRYCYGPNSDGSTRDVCISHHLIHGPFPYSHCFRVDYFPSFQLPSPPPPAPQKCKCAPGTPTDGDPYCQHTVTDPAHLQPCFSKDYAEKYSTCKGTGDFTFC